MFIIIIIIVFCSISFIEECSNRFCGRSLKINVYIHFVARLYSMQCILTKWKFRNCLKILVSYILFCLKYQSPTATIGALMLFIFYFVHVSLMYVCLPVCLRVIKCLEKKLCIPYQYGFKLSPLISVAHSMAGM